MVEGGTPARAAAPIISAGHGSAPAPAPLPTRLTAAAPNRVERAPSSLGGTISAQLNRPGTDQATSGCGGCAPAAPGVAAGPAQLLETTSGRVQAYSRIGQSSCGAGLNTFLGSTSTLVTPRVQYDPTFHRFSLLAVPADAGTTARLYLAVSATANACAAWSVYTISFTGALYPAGTRLDLPYLGQDAQALLGSANDYRGTARINTAVFGIAKSAVYAGQPLDFPAFGTGMSTVPVTVAGNPIVATRTSYFIRAVPGSGYQLYAMTDSAGPGTSVIPLPMAVAGWTAPTAGIPQPGTAVTLDASDGRITATAFQNGNQVWFAHTVRQNGFATVRYGFVDVFSQAVHVARAYKSTTSSDFDPAIAVAPSSPGAVRVWLAWTYTDVFRGRAASDTVAETDPAGTPADLADAGIGLVNGAVSPTSAFGPYSSVAVDPAPAGADCAVGDTVATAQPYFAPSGAWATRIGSISRC